MAEKCVWCGKEKVPCERCGQATLDIKNYECDQGKHKHHFCPARPKGDGEQMPTPVKCGYVGCSFTIDVPDFIVSISTKGVEHLTFEIYDHYFEVHDVPRPVEGKKERE